MQTDTEHPPLALGYHALTPGHIANVVTYLEMRERPRPRPGPVNVRFTLARVPGDDLDGFRALFRAVGEEWLWVSRLRMSDEALRSILSDPNLETYALMARGQAIGILELDFRQEGVCELSFFGLVAGAIGTGAGRYLISQAIAKAWARPIKRFWVHTCTFDSPRAVAFYQRSGFKPYRLAVEVMEDPRLTGESPRMAAPHVLLIEP
jgi:GNAT superfamily N-acetyltransferase